MIKNEKVPVDRVYLIAGRRKKRVVFFCVKCYLNPDQFPNLLRMIFTPYPRRGQDNTR